MRRKVFVLKHNSKRYPVFYYPSSGGKEFLREDIMKHFPVFQKRKLKVVPVIQIDEIEFHIMSGFHNYPLQRDWFVHTWYSEHSKWFEYAKLLFFIIEIDVWNIFIKILRQWILRENTYENIKTMKKVLFVLPYSPILALLAYVFYFFYMYKSIGRMNIVQLSDQMLLTLTLIRIH